MKKYLYHSIYLSSNFILIMWNIFTIQSHFTSPLTDEEIQKDELISPEKYTPVKSSRVPPGVNGHGKAPGGQKKKPAGTQRPEDEQDGCLVPYEEFADITYSDTQI